MTPMKVFQKKPVDKKSKIDTVKLKKTRKLGVLASGIKRDGHKKKSGN